MDVQHRRLNDDAATTRPEPVSFGCFMQIQIYRLHKQQVASITPAHQNALEANYLSIGHTWTQL